MCFCSWWHCCWLWPLTIPCCMSKHCMFKFNGFYVFRNNASVQEKLAKHVKPSWLLHWETSSMYQLQKCVGVFAFKSWSSSWMMTNMVMLVLQMKLLYHPYICVFLSASSMSSFQILGNTKILVKYNQIEHWNLANVVVAPWTSSTSACTWYPAEQMIFHLKINNSIQSTSVCCLISPSFWSA